MKFRKNDVCYDFINDLLVIIVCKWKPISDITLKFRKPWPSEKGFYEIDDGLDKYDVQHESSLVKIGKL